MEFRCRLATPAGEVIEGVYAADDEARLRRELEDRGLLVLSMHRRGGFRGLTLGTRAQRKVSEREFLVFNQELATLLKAGMPLVQSLDILRQRVSNATFKAVLDDVHDKVRAGAALSDAFAAHGALFPAVYTASLMAGERSGSLEEVLRRYVAYEKIIGAVKRRTISALIYPVILVTLMTVLVGIIVFRVIPAFSDFYASFGAELPLSTRIVMAVSQAALANWWLLLAGLVAAVAALVALVKRPEQKERFDRIVLGLPWAGDTARKFATSQMARTLATLLGGGIPLVNALETSARSMTNRFLAGQLDAVALRVREGESFSNAMLARGVFPDVAVKMIEVGESTGALQEMLNSLADFYDEEIETEVGRFITLVEPILLVIMGIVIAVVVLALYMPLFELTAVVGR